MILSYYISNCKFIVVISVNTNSFIEFGETTRLDGNTQIMNTKIHWIGPFTHATHQSIRKGK